MTSTGDTAVPGDTRRLTSAALAGAVNHLLVDWLHNGRRDSPATLVAVCVKLFESVRDGI